MTRAVWLEGDGDAEWVGVLSAFPTWLFGRWHGRPTPEEVEAGQWGPSVWFELQEGGTVRGYVTWPQGHEAWVETLILSHFFYLWTVSLPRFSPETFETFETWNEFALLEAVA